QNRQSALGGTPAQTAREGRIVVLDAPGRRPRLCRQSVRRRHRVQSRTEVRGRERQFHRGRINQRVARPVQRRAVTSHAQTSVVYQRRENRRGGSELKSEWAVVRASRGAER